MLSRGETGLKNILIILILIFSTIGGISGYYYWRAPSGETQIKEINIAAGVVPHHLLAESLVEDFFSYITSKDKPETIVLLSPDHFNAGSILGNSFITLEKRNQELSGVKVDSSLIQTLSLENNLIFSNESINSDHGITGLLPFIRKYFPKTKIIPFIIPSSISLEDTERFATSLNSLASPGAMVIASVDFSHYLPVSLAELHDTKSIRTLVNFEKENFENLEVDSWQALYIARDFARSRSREFPKIIGHLNSIDFLEDKNIEETTSYFSVVFEGENSQKAGEIEEVNSKTVLFAGDIMLDRGVEYLINKNSVYYPFEKISQALKGVDIVVGNLEGPIVEDPPYLSDESLKFAFSPEVVKSLVFSNFNLLSLANNHTLDMGEIGLEQTKDFLRKADIVPIGHPNECDAGFLFKENDITFLAFNKTFPFNCSDDEITEIVKEARTSNSKDFLTVIFHWGMEYQFNSSSYQQNLAHQIIDAGADLVVGHHPHVVQEIEEYKGKLILYSLGNFIFDFDNHSLEETRQGLIVGLEIYPERVVYRLFPIKTHLSQPSLMEPKEAEGFLQELASRSYPYMPLSEQIKNAIIEIER